jgi:hypothetical protein
VPQSDCRAGRVAVGQNDITVVAARRRSALLSVDGTKVAPDHAPLSDHAPSSSGQRPSGQRALRQPNRRQTKRHCRAFDHFGTTHQFGYSAPAVIMSTKSVSSSCFRVHFAVVSVAVRRIFGTSSFVDSSQCRIPARSSPSFRRPAHAFVNAFTTKDEHRRGLPVPRPLIPDLLSRPWSSA